MEHKISLPCSQKPTTGPSPDPDASIPHLSTRFPEIHSNIIFQCLMCGLLPSGLRTKILHAFPISHMLTTCPPLTLLDLITLASYHFHPLRSKYSPQHPQCMCDQFHTHAKQRHHESASPMNYELSDYNINESEPVDTSFRFGQNGGDTECILLKIPCTKVHVELF
jgi:hypothetical protein